MSQEKADLEKLDNPVKRLHLILEKVRNSPGDWASRYVWADALGIDRQDLVSLYHALADLDILFQTARRSVERLKDVNRDRYLKPFDNIEIVITDCALDQPWNRVQKHLDDTIMLTLEMASDVVSVEAGKAAISEEALKGLQAEAETLLEKVLNTDFSSQELKAVLIEYLESIRRAILAYRVSGTEGLHRAVAGALGALFLHREDVNKAAQQDEEKTGILPAFRQLARRHKSDCFVWGNRWATDGAPSPASGARRKLKQRKEQS